jgi:hypothetical protein
VCKLLQILRQTILLVVQSMLCIASWHLESGKTIPKWESGARVVIYVIPSPRHARNVYMVLSVYTGMVSPQFHVQCDDFFETVSPKAGNPELLSYFQKLS